MTTKTCIKTTVYDIFATTNNQVNKASQSLFLMYYPYKISFLSDAERRRKKIENYKE